jgi:2-C-methyl-D-erythritol 4-phosphate cytidylyltransferase
MTEHTSTAPARYFALIPAAGVGARMAADGPKQYLPLGGKPMLLHTLEAFRRCPQIAHTYVVVSPADGQIDALMAQLSADSGVTVLHCGGATRMDSILNGLRTLAGTVHQHDWLLVHDAARPGLTPALVSRLIEQVGDDAVGGLLALPVVDTVKRQAALVVSTGASPAPGTSVTDATNVTTVARAGLWLAQTPQMFRYALLEQALSAATDASQITDDASAIEALGLSPKLVEGHPRNLKVTLPADIRIAEMYLASGEQL